MAAQAVVHLWKEWGLHVLVLLSFTLQVTLLVLAELRRRIDSGVLRAFVWSAYMLADSVAIYAIGHLSVTSQAAEHQVMALWAPLLLVHLGGQDNITAYALEDNRLWLRHLQTLAVQATGAAYVLYVSLLQEPALIGGGGGGRRHPRWLRCAAALLLAVGIAKYGERVWALIRANSSPSGKTYKIAESNSIIDCGTKEVSETDTEGLWQVAHGMLNVAKDLLQAPRPLVTVDMLGHKEEMRGDVMCKVAEIQLPLMHDVLFSKAEVIHTWYGLCIRVFSWVATAVALFLFHAHQVGSCNCSTRKDAAVTYVLLAGAVILEAVSGLRSLVSTWTWWSCSLMDYYRHSGPCPSLFACWRVARALAGLLAALCCCIRAAGDCLPRTWSGSMGQLNLFHMCSSARASRISKTAQGIGVEDWWNVLAYSRSTRVSQRIKDLLVRQVEKSVGIFEESANHIRNSRGQAALERWGAEVLLVESVGLKFEDSILVWHVATDAYLCWYRSRQNSRTHQEEAAAEEDDDLATAVQALSNYMFFLLAARPYMLPPASRVNYAWLCSRLIREEGSEYVCSAEDLVRAFALPDKYRNILQPPDQDDAARMNHIRGDFSRDLPVLSKGSDLCRCLIDMQQLQDAPGAAAASNGNGTTLDLIAQVWSEMICYAGAHCGACTPCGLATAASSSPWPPFWCATVKEATLSLPVMLQPLMLPSDRRWTYLYRKGTVINKPILLYLYKNLPPHLLAPCMCTYWLITFSFFCEKPNTSLLVACMHVFCK
ncbi:unnamed protein product [Urochloa decumbens]|uniref:DUF4220 domain-containing protein n=1 Tax=Urochloa decumbens TaxID=240449 RepID=A0ABC9GGG7_9POAL